MSTEDGVTILEDFGSEPERPSRKRRVILWVTGVAALLALAYGGAALLLQDRVPNNTSVAGVPLGGLGERAAVDRLTERLVVPDTVDVATARAVAQLSAAEVGLEVDIQATVDELTGFSLDPRRLLTHLTGAGEVAPVSRVDEAALKAALEGLRPDLDDPPVEGAITFADGRAQVTQAQAGFAVDSAGAVEVIRTTWLSEPPPVELPSTAVEPEVSGDAVERAMADSVEPLLAGPVTVTTGEISQELSPADLAAHAAMEPREGELELVMDAAGLHARLVELQGALKSEAADARIVLQGGKPTVIPSTTGKGIDPELLAEAVVAATGTPDRVATVELADVEADFTTAQAEELGVVEKVSEFSTPLTSDNVRTQNLINGTRIINGTLVKPGESFSLIDALGPVDAAHGFVSSGVVENGFATKALGGGLSQLSTTTYNAAYFAGMDLVEHKPHSRWFSRYPEGREATMWAPSVDMVWKNSTPHGVLVQAWVAGGRTWVAFWSTPYFDVETRTSGRYNITQPRTVYNTDSDCVPESGGQVGFSVDVTRWRYLDGALHDEEDWSWTYQPWNRVVCGGAPAPEAP